MLRRLTLLLLFVLTPVIALAQSTWTEVGQAFDATSGSASAPIWPAYNNLSQAVYDPSTGNMYYYGRNQASNAQTYSTDLFSDNFNTNTWTSLASTGTSTTTCGGGGGTPTTPDTSATPGNGNPFGNQAFDWRHNYFFLWNRAACTGSEYTLYLFPTSVDSPTTGAFLSRDTSGGPCPFVSCANAWSLQLGTIGGATSPVGAWEATFNYDPQDNYIEGFGGKNCTNQSSTCSSLVNTIWKYVPSNGCTGGGTDHTCTGTLSTVTYSCAVVGTNCPSARAGTSFIWDYYHDDRFIVYGGYTTAGTTDGCDSGSVQASGSDAMWFYFPATATWTKASPTGTAPTHTCYAWYQTYDTLRDRVWMPDDAGGWKYYDVASNSWNSATALVSGPGPACTSRPCGSNPFPVSNSQSFYDPQSDSLVVLTGSGTEAEHVWSIPLQPSFPKNIVVSAPPTDTANRYVRRPMQRPGTQLQTYIDPMSGLTIKRFGNSASRGISAAMDNDAPTYSQTSFWSKNNTYVELANGKIRDAVNGNVICGSTGASKVTNYINNPVWDPASDTRMIGSGGGSLNSNEYVAYNVATCTGSILYNFSATYSRCDHNVGDQDPDKTGTYTMIMCTAIADSKPYVLVLNIKTGELGTPLLGNGAACGGTLTNGPDYAMVDREGKYAMVEWSKSGTDTGTMNKCGMEAFDITQVAHNTGVWTTAFVGQVTPADDHLDLVDDANGNEWIVSYTAQGGWGTGTGSRGCSNSPISICKCPIPNGWGASACVDMLNFTDVGQGVGGHLSCHDYPTIYCVFDDYELHANQRVDDAWRIYKDEIVKIYLDSTNSAPHIKRMAHTYTDPAYIETINTSPCGSSSPSYWAYPKSIIRGDGQQIAYSSNFGPSCSAEAFIITNAADPVSANTSIIWSQVWQTTGGGTFNEYANGYHDIRYDPLTKMTWIYSTSTPSGPSAIYSSRLSYFDSTNQTAGPTVVTDNGQTGSGNCLPSTSALPYSHHPVGQVWNDTLRNRYVMFEGTCGAYIAPEMWYYQKNAPISTGTVNSTSWTRLQPPNIPVANFTHSGVPTTLSSGIDNVTTTIPVASGTAYISGWTVKIDSEYMWIASGGTTNSWTVTRGGLGSTPAPHLSGASVTVIQGQMNGGTCVYDPDHDAAFCSGSSQSGVHPFQVYCDATLNNNILTPAQRSVGCANPNDWTEITSQQVNAPIETYYPNLEYDTVHHRVVQVFADYGSGGDQRNSVYTYDPVTKTWAAVFPAPGLPASFTSVTASATPVFDFSVSTSLTLAQTSNAVATAINIPVGPIHVRICNGGTEYTFTWPSNLILLGTNALPINNSGSQCSTVSFLGNGTTATAYSPMNSTSNNKAARAAHTFNPIDGKIYYHQTARAPGTGVAPAFSASTWVLDTTVPSWTQVTDTTPGPQLTETMAYDPVCNCLISWAYQISSGVYPNNGIATIWVGQFPATTSSTARPTVLPATQLLAELPGNKTNQNPAFGRK